MAGFWKSSPHMLNYANYASRLFPFYIDNECYLYTSIIVKNVPSILLLLNIDILVLV